MNTWENRIIDGKMSPVVIKDRYIELSPNNIYELIDGLRNADINIVKISKINNRYRLKI